MQLLLLVCVCLQHGLLHFGLCSLETGLQHFQVVLVLNDLLLALNQFGVDRVLERNCESAETTRVEAARLLLQLEQFGLVSLLLVPLLHLLPVQLLERLFEVILQLFELVSELRLHPFEVGFVLLVVLLALHYECLLAVHMHLV